MQMPEIDLPVLHAVLGLFSGLGGTRIDLCPLIVMLFVISSDATYTPVLRRISSPGFAASMAAWMFPPGGTTTVAASARPCVKAKPAQQSATAVASRTMDRS